MPTGSSFRRSSFSPVSPFPLLRVVGLKGSWAAIFSMALFRGIRFHANGVWFRRSSFFPVSPFRLLSFGAWALGILGVHFFYGTFSRDSLSCQRGLVFEGHLSLRCLPFVSCPRGRGLEGILGVDFVSGTFSKDSLSCQRGLVSEGHLSLRCLPFVSSPAGCGLQGSWASIFPMAPFRGILFPANGV